MNFGSNVLRFHQQLQYKGSLPAGIRIMNPFRESDQAMPILKQFCKKFLNDDHKRHIILGINPGRFGGGLTGIPFTDPKRLMSECDIMYNGQSAHEPSSVFIYEMINAYGGAKKFYQKFYINSPCPLGFTSINAAGREVNYNYYDSPALASAVRPFMIKSVKQLIGLGIHTDVAFCLGAGKNEKFLSKLNSEFNFFGKLVPLEHPRFIMQYKSKTKQHYIDKYLDALMSV